MRGLLTIYLLLHTNPHARFKIKLKAIIIYHNFLQQFFHQSFIKFCNFTGLRLDKFLQHPDAFCMLFLRHVIHTVLFLHFTQIKKNITIDGMEVPFKASAAVPRLYRLKFHRDIYKDFASLKTDVEEGDENKSELDIESLEVFENIAYIMAKHADPENVPDSPDDFLEQFNTFSIYEILPQLIELWGLNTATQIESKKNIARLTGR